MFVQRGYNNFEIEIEDAPSFLNTYSTSFDGVDDRLDIGTALNLGTDSTISMWIKRGRVSTVEILLGEETYGFNLTSYINASNQIIFQIGSYSQNFNAFPISTILNDTTNWIHICFVRSGDSVELFLNGVSMQTHIGFGAIVDTRFDEIASRPPGQLHFMGNVDEVAGWNVNTINPLDIYNGGTPNSLTALSPYGWWRFEEGSGTTAIDSGSGGNNGTLINGVAYSTDVP